MGALTKKECLLRCTLSDGTISLDQWRTLRMQLSIVGVCTDQSSRFLSDRERVKKIQETQYREGRPVV